MATAERAGEAFSGRDWASYKVLTSQNCLPSRTLPMILAMSLLIFDSRMRDAKCASRMCDIHAMQCSLSGSIVAFRYVPGLKYPSEMTAAVSGTRKIGSSKKLSKIFSLRNSKSAMTLRIGRRRNAAVSLCGSKRADIAASNRLCFWKRAGKSPYTNKDGKE